MSDAQPDLVATFAELQSLTLTTPGVDVFLDEVAQLAARLAPATSCSVTLGSTAPYTAAFTDALALQVDEVQYEDDAGPCLDAIRRATVHLVPDVAADPRWPDYRRRAAEAGVRSSLSLPLPVLGTTIGGLNLYSREVDGFAPPLREALALFAAQAAAALTMVRRSDRQSELTTQLHQALASRSVIDQALGVLMAQQRCSPTEAFALLRAHSQNTGRKLRDVAADLVERVSGTPPTTTTTFTSDDLP